MYKNKEEVKNEFQKRVKDYTDTDDYKKNFTHAPKCMSDHGMLWLRYGMYKVKSTAFYNISNQLNEIHQEFDDWCVKIYDEEIRGNMEYTNRPLSSTVASLIYIGCCKFAIQLTQKDISEIFGISEGTLRKNYTILMKNLIHENKQCIKI